MSLLNNFVTAFLMAYISALCFSTFNIVMRECSIIALSFQLKKFHCAPKFRKHSVIGQSELFQKIYIGFVRLHRF